MMGRRLERRQPRGPLLGWLAALLGASILTSHFSPVQTASLEMVPVTWEPSRPLTGGDVTMTPGGNLTFIYCMWHRQYQKSKASLILMYFRTPDSKQTPGRLYTGRETAGPDCSLHIRNLTLRDSGRYLVAKIGQNFNYETGNGTIKLNALGPLEIAGIVMGALSAAVLIGVLLYYVFRYYRQRTAQRVSKSSLSPSAPAVEPTV